MNTYILVLGHTEPTPRTECEPFLDRLRSVFPTAFDLQHHIFLFQSEKGPDDAFAALPTPPHQNDRALLFHAIDFRGGPMRGDVFDRIHGLFRTSHGA